MATEDWTTAQISVLDFFTLGGVVWLYSFAPHAKTNKQTKKLNFDFTQNGYSWKEKK